MNSRPDKADGPELAPQSALSIGDRIPSHNPACFGCGVDSGDGLQMRMTVTADDTVTGQFTVREPHQGAPGLIHGGVLSAAFDEILGAVNWLLGSAAVTAKLETNYLKPIPVDSELTLRAWIDRVDGRKVYLLGEAHVADGTKVASAHGLFIRVPIEHFTTHGRAVDIDRAIEKGNYIWKA